MGREEEHRKPFSLVEGKWRKQSLDWHGECEWPQPLAPRLAKCPCTRLSSSFSGVTGLCPPATLEPSWPRRSRTEAAVEMRREMPCPCSLESSSQQPSEQMGHFLYQKGEEVSGQNLGRDSFVLERSPE